MALSRRLRPINRFVSYIWIQAELAAKKAIKSLKKNTFWFGISPSMCYILFVFILIAWLSSHFFFNFSRHRDVLWHWNVSKIFSRADEASSTPIWYFQIRFCFCWLLLCCGWIMECPKNIQLNRYKEKKTHKFVVVKIVYKRNTSKEERSDS